MLTDANERAFEERKLDLEIATKMGAKFEGGKFLFDYRRNGITQFRKVRTADKNFWLEPKGKPLQLWNLDAIRDLPSNIDEPLIITEGEFDAIAVMQAVGGHVVSVPNGAPATPSQAPILVSEDARCSYLWGEDERLIREVDQFEKIILFTDNDKPGRILRDELAMRIGDSRCWRVSCPDDCKDANDILAIYGPDALKRVVSEAVPLRPGALLKPKDAPKNPHLSTYGHGWTKLADHLRLITPELIVVTGIPGHGKSQWVRAFTFRLAKENAWKIAYLTPEDPPYRLVRDMERYAKRLHDPRYPLTPAEESEAEKWLDDHFVISVPKDDDPLTLDFVEAEMASAVLHHDCKVFVIDPWNEISHERGRRTDTEYIEQALVRLKRKCRRWGLVLIIVAHPTKLQDGDKPTLYSISGSANWYNKCDHGLVIYRPVEDEPTVSIKVAKSKDHEIMGKPGEVWMKFKSTKADYEELPRANP